MNEQARQAFGRRLREEREHLVMSQTQFAEVAGVKRVAQYLYEKGERAPDLDYLLRVSELGTDLIYLLTGKREARPKQSSRSPGFTTDDVLTIVDLLDAINETSAPPLAKRKRQATVEMLCKLMLRQGGQSKKPNLAQVVQHLAKAL